MLIILIKARDEEVPVVEHEIVEIQEDLNAVTVTQTNQVDNTKGQRTNVPMIPHNHVLSDVTEVVNGARPQDEIDEDSPSPENNAH